jgi:hypothetical protein
MAKRLTRKQLAEFLSNEGYPISVAWLNRLAMPSIGGGPPAVGMWGRRPLYDPAAALAWAEARFRPIEPEAPLPAPQREQRGGPGRPRKIIPVTPQSADSRAIKQPAE